MSKERLEELKKMRLLYEVCFVDDYASAIDDATDDVNWLIERVQELEEENFQLKDDVNRMENEYLHGIKVENKRYREVINNINEKAMLYGVDEQVYEAIKEAIKAVEGEE